MALGAGTVWVATLIACPNVLGTDQCQGTSSGDVMTATDEDDSIAGLGGRHRINDAAKQDIDTINGGPDNDTIDVREGNTGLNNRDLVDCGKGKRDRVFYDTAVDGDKVARCEIKNPD